METASDRLKKFRKSNKLTQSEFGRSIGRTQSAITQLETGQTEVSAETLRLLYQRYGLSSDWLLHDIGEMQIQPYTSGGARKATNAKLTNQTELNDASADDNGLQVIRHFDCQSTTGASCLVPVEQSSFSMAFTKSWFLEKGIESSLAGLIMVNDESMAPSMRVGTRALVHYAETQVESGKIYAFGLHEKLYLRRLVVIDQGFVIVADNADFPPAQIVGKEAKQIRVLGRVRAVISELDSKVRF